MSLASLLIKGSLRRFATATPATFATNSRYGSPTVATLATVAVAKAPDEATNDLTPDPDGWCWPHSTAITGREIDAFTARLSRFADKGLSLDDGAALAYKLVIRDRESDDRWCCLECRHLAGYGSASWRCSNWKPASVGASGLPLDLVLMLQRCDAFGNLNILGLLQSRHEVSFQ